MPKSPVSKTTPSLTDEQLAALQTLMPQAFSEGRIDFEKLRATLGDMIDDSPERYSFSWAGKRDAIRLLQAPSRATLIPCPEESVFNMTYTKDTTGEKVNRSVLSGLCGEFFSAQNLFIEGDNLEVLKLLYKPYFGRVKMIYIDPPYNTGNDFVYPDNFADPLDTYLKLTGQKDSEGNLLTSNPETGGRYHSAWLSMMYPRLFLARQLLREGGVIFVSIDDHEVHNLRLLMNEIFGEENLLACIVWKRRQVSDNRNLNQVSTDHEYILAYAKGQIIFTGIEKDITKYQNPDDDPRGPWMSDNMTGLASREERPNLHYDLVNPETGISYPPHPTRGWIYERKTMQRMIAENRILWPINPDGRPRLKRFLNNIRSKFTGFSSVQDIGYTTDGTREFVDLFGEKLIAFPKPVALIRILCQQTTSLSEDDIVLDFFAGSCTTAQAMLELNREDGGNRRFIMVQLPEPTGNQKFPTIAEISKERIRRVVARMKGVGADGRPPAQAQLPLETRETPEDLGFKVFKLARSNYRPWPVGATRESPDRPDAAAYARQAEMFADPLVGGWKPENLLYEVALKEGYGLNIMVEPTAVKDVQRVTDPDKGQSFYLCLSERIVLDSLKLLNLQADYLFICRDSALDDEAAANLALQCRLKTI